MPVRVEWNGDKIVDEVERRIFRNTSRATQIVRNQTVRLLNRTQPRRSSGSGRLVGLVPSRPFEPPKRLSNRLIQSVATRVVRLPDRVRGSVGTNVVYARRLELGFVGRDARGRTISQAPRPAFRVALIQKRDEVLRALVQE